MPPHPGHPPPLQLSTMLWIMHVPNTNLLILIMQSKSSFLHLPGDILFRNSQNLYLVIVSDNIYSLPSIILSDPHGLFLRM